VQSSLFDLPPPPSDDNCEWYTPGFIVEGARATLGAIDLDPASCDAANRVVKARSIYTVESNGLAQMWSGRVWMNPPYGRELVEQFTEKLVSHFLAGDVTSALCLTNNCTETDWWGHIAFHAACVLFPSRRIPFWGPLAAKNGPRQGQTLFLLTEDLEIMRRFQKSFEGLGCIARVIA